MPQPGVRPLVRHVADIPPGYVFVPHGNKYMSKHCRKLTEAEGKSVYKANSGSRTLGMHVPSNIYTMVKKLIAPALYSPPKSNHSAVLKFIWHRVAGYDRPMGEDTRYIRFRRQVWGADKEGFARLRATSNPEPAVREQNETVKEDPTKKPRTRMPTKENVVKGVMKKNREARLSEPGWQ